MIFQLDFLWKWSPAHANKLVNQDKITSIEELRKHPKRDQLLNKTQQLGLKYLEEIEQKIPRDQMKQMEVSWTSIHFDFDSISFDF